MANIYIKNGNVILKDRIISGATIAINNGNISAISKKMAPKKGSFLIDAKGCFVSPGFIDCHIHGEPEKIFLNEARHGTTAFVVAESCAPLNYIYKRAESIKEFIKTHPFGPNVLGLRLEGPYISKTRAGAQDAGYIRRPDTKELSKIIERCCPILKLMTVAPELRSAKPLIKLLHKYKIIASIGHSDATYEQAVEGVDAGITHATHTFNAMSGTARRNPGVVGAVLMDDRVIAEVILDFIHVHRALFGLLLKLKNRNKVIVVTDSLVSEPSKNTMAVDGAYRFADGRLAGSSLTMIGALKNAVKSFDLSLQEALNMITLNPARLLGVESKKGSIAAGKDADIVIFDKEFDVKMTMIRGRIAFVKGKICAG
jgi:N-acetylglucosamine-6-phosphate deacetylase